MWRLPAFDMRACLWTLFSGIEGAGLGNALDAGEQLVCTLKVGIYPDILRRSIRLVGINQQINPDLRKTQLLSCFDIIKLVSD